MPFTNLHVYGLLGRPGTRVACKEHSTAFCKVNIPLSFASQNGFKRLFGCYQLCCKLASHLPFILIKLNANIEVSSTTLVHQQNHGLLAEYISLSLISDLMP
ncbi:unnamed protein product [Miscanthus lutarioriparius]|uniref:Uncharacterized protein n=1 Tax=Miscanthus lutarioriparius TaxID=422564 RepID=A0A811RJF5_9POAL|nr:unnamed protein product [Miscanthus lutarioriparius]